MTIDTANKTTMHPANDQAAVPPERAMAEDPTAIRLPSHIPALDGVRGLAVLLVLWCHAIAVEMSAGGLLNRLAYTSARVSWTGVDLFFVLSGFLITGILYDSKGKDHYFRNFYARRTVRIFPLYYAALCLFFIVLPKFGAALPYYMRMEALPTSQIWYWLYLSNYSQGIMAYFGHDTHHISFISWSLAIEEQFYLMWPAVVFFFGRRTLIKICTGMFFFAMLSRIAVWLLLDEPGRYAWSIAYVFTPCRLDGLGLGAVIALICRGPSGVRCLVKPAKIIGPLAALGIVAVIGSMAAMGYRKGLGQTPGYTMFGATLFALLYGSVLVAALNLPKTTLVGGFLSSGIMRMLGKYSYAIYLLHLPVMLLVDRYLFSLWPVIRDDSGKAIAKEHVTALFDGRSLMIGDNWLLPAIVFCLITFTLTVLVALISWNILEKHFLRLKDLFPMEAKKKHAA